MPRGSVKRETPDLSWAAVFDDGPMKDSSARIWAVPPVHTDLWFIPDPRGEDRGWALIAVSASELTDRNWDGQVHYTLVRVEDDTTLDTKQVAHYMQSPMSA